MPCSFAGMILLSSPGSLCDSDRSEDTFLFGRFQQIVNAGNSYMINRVISDRSERSGPLLEPVAYNARGMVS